MSLFFKNILFLSIRLLEKLDIESASFNEREKLIDTYTLFYDLENKIVKKDDQFFIVCSMLNDALIWLDTNKSTFYELVIMDLIQSISPTLNKIALISLRESVTIECNNKIKIVLDSFDLYDLNIKTELFRIIGTLFNDICENLQILILNKIIDKLDETNNLEDKFKNYETYNWLVWLITETKNSVLVIDIYEKYKYLFSDFGPREHPELSMTISSVVWGKDISPIDMDTLINMSISDIVDYLETFKESINQFNNDISREGLLRQIEEYGKLDFLWTKDFLKELNERKNYKIDIWPYLIKDLGKEKLEKDDFMFILNIINNKALIIEHGMTVGELVHDIINENKYIKLNAEFEQIILSIIDYLYKYPTYNINENESEVMVAINSTNENVVLILLSLINKDNKDIGIMYLLI